LNLKASSSVILLGARTFVKLPFLFLPLPLAMENFVDQLDTFGQLGFVAIHGKKLAKEVKSLAGKRCGLCG